MHYRIVQFFMVACIIFYFGCEGPTGKDNKTSEITSDAGQVAEKPCYGDTIVLGSIGDASNLIPILASDGVSHQVAGYIYNGLVKYDKDLKITGDLAESWDISPDNLSITFHLKKGVQWHDGTPFTADDVLFTYNITIDPKTPTPYKENFKQLKSVKVIDPLTIRVEYREPYAKALITWAASILPMHLLKGEDITQSPLSRKPVGTGPFKFKEWHSGERIVLEYNQDYFEGRPYIDRIVLRIIPDMATMFLELKAGKIDMMNLTPLQYKRQTNQPDFNKTYTKYRYLAFAYTYLGYNLLDPLFKDIRVRQAISYTINREELVTGVLFGLGRVASGPYKPGTWPYNPDVERFDYDPAKARILFKEAGWEDRDNDGALEDANGKPFKFTIITNQGNDSRLKAAQIIQQRLREAGITVEIRVIEWAAFLKEFIEKRNFQATILGWNILQDPDLYNVWHSEKSEPGGLNFISFKNKRVDELLEKGRRILEQEKRKGSYFEIQEILAKEQAYTFLWVPDSLPVVNSRFKNITPAPAGIEYNFIKWYVPKEEQLYKTF